MIRLLLLIALLAGCSEPPDRSAQRAARRDAAQAKADQPPGRTVHRFDNGELMVLDIRTVAPGGFADSQKCYLWRDAEFHTASLQCPADAQVDLSGAAPESDKSRH